MPATSFTSWKLMVSIFSMLSSRSVSVYSMSSAEMLLQTRFRQSSVKDSKQLISSVFDGKQHLPLLHNSYSRFALLQFKITLLWMSCYFNLKLLITDLTTDLCSFEVTQKWGSPAFAHTLIKPLKTFSESTCLPASLTWLWRSRTATTGRWLWWRVSWTSDL